jgi:hypothetical protein
VDPLRDRRRGRCVAIARAGFAAAIVAAALLAWRLLGREGDTASQEPSSGEATPIAPDGLRAFAEHWDATDASGAEELHPPRAVEPPGIEARRRIAPPRSGPVASPSPQRSEAPRPDDAGMRFAPRARDLDPNASR